jgi:hypothetical protein
VALPPGAPGRLRHLSDFYGTLSTRIDYNNELYDAVHQDITFYDASAAWDFERERWLTSDPAARAAFANSARLTRGVWTRWYLDLMEDYVAAQGGTMAAVREYLRLNGG